MSWLFKICVHKKIKLYTTLLPSMSYIADKFKPTSQKSLFHKDVVFHIRKWIVSVDDLSKQKKPVQNVLIISGPSGSGKSSLVEIMFKAFNMYNIDPSELQTDMSSCITSIRGSTLENIEKINSKAPVKHKQNIVYFDNMDMTERNVASMMNHIYNDLCIDIPIIITCADIKSTETIRQSFECTVFELQPPSLLELSKLVGEINTAENLQLTNDNMFKLIQYSCHDTRQLLQLLDQWRLKTENFHSFCESIQLKNIDIDLCDKLNLVFSREAFSLSDMYTMAASEPVSISNGIYQNYTTNIQNNMEGVSSISEELSASNTVFAKICDDQAWELYDFYAFASCVLPAYHVKQNLADTDTCMIVPFKDISYNFINSLREIEDTCNITIINGNNIISPSLTRFFIERDMPSYCLLANMLIGQLQKLNVYFDNTKRGKNTTKKEKLEIYKNIVDDNTKSTMYQVTRIIMDYRLFEVDTVGFSQAKKVDDTCIELIDLRMLKRFINVSSIHDTSKCIKSHVEAAIKCNLLQQIITEMSSKPRLLENRVESLTQDLESIWDMS